MIAGLYAKSSFVCKKLPTVFHGGCTVLQSHQQWIRVPVVVPQSPRREGVSVLELGHPNKRVVGSHCFKLHFPDDIRCGGDICSMI